MANVAVRGASAAAAQARLDRALLNLSYCKIYAPVSGIVTKKNAEVGQRVSPGQQLLLLAQGGDLWVTANFKETQLDRIRSGQRATVQVDALDRTFSGHVDSLSGATGARTSLLPPENATGNYVKVVQRLPVRVLFDPNQSGLERFRVGMSVEVLRRQLLPPRQDIVLDVIPLLWRQSAPNPLPVTQLLLLLR